MKRVLSLIISIMMLISLLPTQCFFVSANESAQNLVYNFKSEVFEYNKIPRTKSSSSGIKAIRYTGSDITAETLDPSKTLIMNPDHLSWDFKMNKVTNYVEDGSVASDPYYIMRSTKSTTLEAGTVPATEPWKSEYASKGAINRRAIGGGLSVQFNMNRYVDETNTGLNHITAGESIDKTVATPRFTIRLYVPTPGKYKFNYSNLANSTSTVKAGAAANVYFGKAPATTITDETFDDVVATSTKLGVINTMYPTNTANGNYGVFDKVLDISEAGEYIVLFDTDENTYNLNPVNPSKKNYTYSSKRYLFSFIIDSITLTPVNMPTSLEVEFDERSENIHSGIFFNATAKALSGTDEFSLNGTDVTWSSTDSNVATINAKTGAITTKNEGTTDIIAEITVEGTKFTGKKTLTVKKLSQPDDAITYNMTTNAFFIDKMYVYSTLPSGKKWTELTDGLRSGKIVSNFSLAGWKTTVNKNVDGNVVDPFYIMDLDKTAPWSIEIPYVEGFNSYRIIKENTVVEIKPSYYGNNSLKRPYLAYRLRVPYAGSYNFEVYSATADVNSALFDVHLGMAEKEKYSSGEIDGLIANKNFTKIGTYQSAKGATTKVGTVKIDKPGEYILIFNTTEENFAKASDVKQNSSGIDLQSLYISELKLIPIELPTSVEISFSDNSSNLYEGTSFKASLKAFGNNGDYSLEGIKTSWKSSDTKVAAIDENGVIYAGKAGTCTISADVLIAGTKYTAEKKLSIEVWPSIGNKAPITYVLKSGAFKLDKMYSYQAAPNNSWENAVDGTRQGSLIMNYILMHWNATVNKDADGNKVEPFFIMDNAKTAQWGVEVPFGDSVYSYQLHSNYMMLQLHSDKYGEDSQKRPYVAFRVRIPYAGKFKLNAYSSSKGAQNALLNVHFGPAEKQLYKAKEIDALIKDKAFKNVGTFISKADADQNIGWVNVEKAGEYILIFNPTTELFSENPNTFSNSSGSVTDLQSIYISEITLDPIDEINVAGVSVSDEIQVGSYSVAKAMAYTVSGAEADLSLVPYKFTSSDEKIAVIDPVTGEIYAKNVGSVEISVELEAYGEKIVGKKTIAVKSDKVCNAMPENLNFSFPLGFLGVGESQFIKITDENGEYPGSGLTFKYEVEDKTVVAENDGCFTGISLGKSNVKVSASLGNEEKEFEFVLPVVGENMLLRHGVNHGEFEAGVFLSDGSFPGIKNENTFWRATKDQKRDIYKYEYQRDVISDITGRKTNIFKVLVDNTPSTTPDSWFRVFRIENSTAYYDENGTSHAGSINVEDGKIYEFSGFVKLDNVKVMPAAMAQMFYYSIDGNKLTELANMTVNLWTGLSGNQPWTYFTTGPICMNYDQKLGIRPKIQFSATDENIGYDISLAHMSFREVKFDTVDFKMQGSLDGVKTYDTFKTTLQTYTSTGKPITFAKSGGKINVEYSSTNPVVAKVSDTGVITVVSDGECEIQAKVTIGNETQVGIIPISVSDLDVMFESIRATSSKTELIPGETADLSVKYYNTDQTEYTGEDVTLFYESATPEIATVDQNGTVTAKAAGKAIINVFASTGSYNTRCSVDIAVIDTTKLVSAKIVGPTSVEEKFDIKLSVTATHESGSAADISRCDVNFALVNDEDSAIIRVSSDGTVTGVSEGTAKVIATVSANDSTVTTEPFEVEVTVNSPRGKLFDFCARPANTSALNATIEEDEWRVNRNETSHTRITEALNGDFKRIRHLAHGIQFSAPKADNTVESDITFDIKVDYSGWYQPLFVGARTQSGKPGILYINGEYAGRCDFSAEDDDVNNPISVKLNPVYLEKGINTLTVRALVAGYVYPRSLTLNYIDSEPALSEVIINTDADSVPVGASIGFDVGALLDNGSMLNFGLNRDGSVNKNGYYTLTDAGEGDVDISENTLTGVGAGNVTLTAKVFYNGSEFSPTKDINVTPEGFTSVVVSAESWVMAPGGNGYALTVKAINNIGAEMDMTGASVEYESSDEAVVTVDDNGFMTPGEQGTATVFATVTMPDGVAHTGSMNVSVRFGKTKSTYYTKDEIAAARENIEKYDWAKADYDTIIQKADYYVSNLDTIYELIPSQGVPRGYANGYTGDPNIRICKYCGKSLHTYGTYPWSVKSGLIRPWKVQCPECQRYFPSNDFAKLFELGKNEHGEYDVNLAHERNEQLKAETNGEVDYLKNILYPELYNPSSSLYNKDPLTGDTIDGTKWGVDDGLGYDTGRVYPNGVPEVHIYVAIYNHMGLWYAAGGDGGNANPQKEVIKNSLNTLRDAYLYTGNKKYGRAGAIILDRVADFYPDLNMREYYDEELGIVKFQNSGASYGKAVGAIWEAGFMGPTFSTSYDAFFDIYDDPQVITYLSEKANKYNYEDKLADVNSETGEKRVTSETLRRNVEKNILEETLVGVQNALIAGNFGFKQDSLAKAAVILDTQPKTQEIIDFVMKPGTVKNGKCSGGNVMPQIMNTVDRDGIGTESSLSYNKIWATNLLEMAQTLSGYEDVEVKDDLLANPKYIKMLQIEFANILAGIRRANIGDAGTAGLIGLSFSQNLFLAALESIDKWDASDEFKEEKRILFSQILYYSNGNTVKGLHSDIFTKNPEALQKNIDAIIKKHGEYNPVSSSLFTGYGFASIQDGIDYRNQTSESNLDITTRDFWMYFGGGGTMSHRHYDTLNIGVDAFGMNMSPDLGYPPDTGGQGNDIRQEWVSGTISHNTVQVNENLQTKPKYSGDVMHFDGEGEVKVMDVNAPAAYGETDIYRRTIVSVDVDDTVSYGLDFFRVVGGDEHVYSFHAQADNTEITGLDMIKQPMGTYAGADIPYGDTAYSAAYDTGYNWLENVKRARNPETGTFTADFDIKRMRKITFKERDWHLRLTMLNDFNLSEVTVCNGRTPAKGKDSDIYEYLLARRSGKNLDTLFTTVLEPYIGSSNIKTVERVKVTRENGLALRSNEPVAAIKVTLNNGRVDYVVYATNTKETYRIDDLFDFSGFVGVYTVSDTDSKNYVRSYILDGTKIGEKQSVSAIKGKVKNFTKELRFENFIELEVETEIPEGLELEGKLLSIKNDGIRNGDYVITSAEQNGNVLTLGIGDITTIRGYVDAYDTSKGYEYNIEVGQSAEVALDSYYTSAPIIEKIKDHSMTAGSAITVPIKAFSEEGREITLVPTTLPRGMMLDTEKNQVVWTPTASQIGKNHVAVTADDGILSSTVRFTIEVFGSTTGETTTPSIPSGGSGGGGGGSTPTIPQTPGSSESPQTPSTPMVPETDSNIRFIDIGNYGWAVDAINALADEGIIKGTSENTFSPAANITRADFAILLVRAFKLASENTENFADVSASDYFAKELAVARNTGLVNGIGENKFAPRNNITRQDMMVIVYRALVAMEKEFDTTAILASDFANVSDYAKDAVSALVNAKLVNGKNGLIAPTDYTTRAEVAVLVKRILEFI